VKYQIVRITWIDACSEVGWTALSDIKTNSIITCQTVGWLISEDRKQVVVTTTFAENDQCTDPMCIPKKCIIKRKLLKDI